MIAKKNALCLFFLSYLSSVNFVYADSAGRIGDVGQYAIPAMAGVSSLFLRDFQGVGQLILSAALVEGVTEGLKAAIHEQRPNKQGYDSFPSGHTALAFTGAAYMQFRYGALLSLPFYAASTYVAYSRVHVGAHHVQDVIGGAVVAIAGTYVLTTPSFRNKDVAFFANGKYAGILYRKVFE